MSSPMWCARGATSASAGSNGRSSSRPTSLSKSRHPYFLNQWVPREGISREQYLTTKFGSAERYKSIAKRVAAGRGG